MISLNGLKRDLKKKGKKINKENLLLIKKYTEKIIFVFLKDIAKESDYMGRKVIRKEDIKAVFEKQETKYSKWEL